VKQILIERQQVPKAGKNRPVSGEGTRQQDPDNLTSRVDLKGLQIVIKENVDRLPIPGDMGASKPHSNAFSANGRFGQMSGISQPECGRCAS